MKHSQASAVTLSLTYEDSNIHLFYADNGIGLDVSQLEHHSLQFSGLIGIRERVKGLDGTVEFAVNNGLQLTIYLTYLGLLFFYILFKKAQQAGFAPTHCAFSISITAPLVPSKQQLYPSAPMVDQCLYGRSDRKQLFAYKIGRRRSCIL